MKFTLSLIFLISICCQSCNSQTSNDPPKTRIEIQKHNDQIQYLTLIKFCQDGTLKDRWCDPYQYNGLIRRHLETTLSVEEFNALRRNSISMKKALASHKPKVEAQAKSLNAQGLLYYQQDYQLKEYNFDTQSYQFDMGVPLGRLTTIQDVTLKVDEAMAEQLADQSNKVDLKMTYDTHVNDQGLQEFTLTKVEIFTKGWKSKIGQQVF